MRKCLGSEISVSGSDFFMSPTVKSRLENTNIQLRLNKEFDCCMTLIIATIRIVKAVNLFILVIRFF